MYLLQDDGTPGKGRHNIRKLLADKKLGNQTKAAVREEKERRDRVAKLKEKVTSKLNNSPVYKRIL